MKKCLSCMICILFLSEFAYSQEEWKQADQIYTIEKSQCDEKIPNICSWRDSDPDKYIIASADFDGDGRIDKAFLAISSDQKKSALIVEISSQNRKIILSEEKELLAIFYMGVSVQKPSKKNILTACGKGYWSCEKNEPSKIQLKLPVIDYFQYGSANSYFIWNKKKLEFNRTWISD